jgi:hypothetical protein
MSPREETRQAILARRARFIAAALASAGIAAGGCSKPLAPEPAGSSDVKPEPEPDPAPCLEIAIEPETEDAGPGPRVCLSEAESP